MQRTLSVLTASLMLALVLTSAALADGPKTPGERALRAATEAADSAAILAALDQIDAERHGSAPPAAKPVEPPKPVEPAARSEKAVEITAEPPAAVKPAVKRPYAVDLDRLPNNRRDAYRQHLADWQDWGGKTGKETLDEAREVFYSKDKADATTISLSGRVRELERKVDGIKAAQATPPKTNPEKPAGSSTGAGAPPAGGGSTPQPSRWHLPLWAWLAIAAVLLVAVLLILVGRRREWAPRTWVSDRVGGMSESQRSWLRIGLAVLTILAGAAGIALWASGHRLAGYAMLALTIGALVAWLWMLRAARPDDSTPVVLAPE